MLVKFWQKSYSVTITYINSGKSDSLGYDLNWYLKHIQESQYLLQIVKWEEKNCCSPACSELFHILKGQFIPPSIKMIQLSNNIITSEKGVWI